MFKVNAKVLKKVVDLVIDGNALYNGFGLNSESFQNNYRQLNSYLECLQDLKIISEEDNLNISVLQYKELKEEEIEFKVTEILVRIPNKAIDDFDLVEQL